MLKGYIGALLPFLMHEGSRVRFRGHADAGEVFDFRSLMGGACRYRPTNKGGRRPATKPARPRRTRAQKLRTQARRAR